jgi:nucleoside phosphorylase
VSAQPPQAPAPGQAQVDLALLIALPEEFRVLIQALGTDYQHVLDASDGSHTYYFQRPAAQHPQPYRCAAKLVGAMGSLNTGLAAQHLLERLNPATLVMLGIAGGLSADLSLGDVVVATQADDYLAQAKAVHSAGEQGFTYERSGEVYRSSTELVRAAQNLEFAYPSQFAHWSAEAAAARDRLVPATAQGELQQAGLLRAQARFETGHIACGSTVGATPGFTNWLKLRDRKYLALEMEVVGMLAAVYERVEQRRTLVLRGISDFADERKAQLDRVQGGALRTLAMHNAVQLLWALLEAGLLARGA